MEYLLIDCVNGDQFEKSFKNKDEAIKEGEQEWQHLTNHDKKRRDYFYLLAANNSFDGDVIKQWK